MNKLLDFFIMYGAATLIVWAMIITFCLIWTTNFFNVLIFSTVVSPFVSFIGLHEEAGTE